MRLRPVHALPVVLSVAATVEAQEAVSTLPTISVEATIPEEVRFSPGAASVLDEQEIDTYRPFTLHDALDFVPGVRTIDDDIYGRRTGIGIRGAPARRSRKVLLLEDGVPVNASTYLDPSTHYTPPLERLESVDVLKGAGHVLHGPLNNHGIINFRNKRPTLEPQTTVEVGVGNLDANTRHAMHTRTMGDVGMVFAYTGMTGDGSFDIERFHYDDFFTSFDWAVNERHDLGLSFVYFRERSDYDESNLLPAEYARAPRTKRGRFSQIYDNFNIDYYKLDLVHDFQITRSWSSSTRVFFTDLDRARFTVEPGEVTIGPTGLPLWGTLTDPFLAGQTGVMIGRDRHYTTYGAENRMEWGDVQFAGLDHTFQWGVRYERQFLDEQEPLGIAGQVLDADNRGSLFNPNLGEASGEQNRFQAWAASVFLQDAMRLGDWTVTPGLRFEYYSQSRKLVVEDGAPTGDSSVDDTNALLLPSISFLYTGLERTQVFANVGRGYTPAFARTARPQDFPLVPETGINSQIGLRSNLITGVSFEGAVFYNIIQNTVVQLPFTFEGSDIYLNSADSHSYGVDLGLRLDSWAFIDSPYNFFGEVAYNYTEATFTENGFGESEDGDPVFARIDGNDVPEVPNHTGSLSLGVEHTAGWQVSGTLSFMSSFFTDPANTTGRVLATEDGELVVPGDDLEIREPAVLGEVPGRMLVSARASYTPPSMPNTRFWLQGRNLTNKLYVSDFANGLRPGAERQVMGGVTLSF